MTRIRKGGGPGIVLALLLIGTALPLIAQGESDRSVLAPLARQSLLLDGATKGDLAVAVGERGHVLVSRDQGRTWDQRQVPTHATLTAVYLHSDTLGWAVGHDAVILRTRDGGETWDRVYFAPEEERPLLDVWFRDESHGFAIGAYGYFLATEDGGDSWTPMEIGATDEEEDEFYGGGFDYHLNHLAKSDSGRLYIAAEAGTVYRSDDGGESWVSLPSPYEGSFFGSLTLDDDALLLFGLRGHLYRSGDAGETWTRLETSTTAMITDGIRLQDRTIVLAALSGTQRESNDGGLTFTLRQRDDRLGTVSILQTDDGGLILVGEGGVRRIEGL